VEFHAVLKIQLASLPPLEQILDQAQLDESCENLTAAIQRNIQEQVPIMEITPKSKCWWTKELTLLCKWSNKLGRLSRAVLVPPSLSYKPVTSASCDCGNISHDPTCDSSCNPSATRTSHDLSARDPGNLRPHDPGKITHDLSRKWSSTMSPDQTHFGCASNLLINTWQIVGTINKTRPLNNQRTRDAT